MKKNDNYKYEHIKISSEYFSLITYYLFAPLASKLSLARCSADEGARPAAGAPVAAAAAAVPPSLVLGAMIRVKAPPAALSRSLSLLFAKSFSVCCCCCCFSCSLRSAAEDDEAMDE